MNWSNLEWSTHPGLSVELDLATKPLKKPGQKDYIRINERRSKVRAIIDHVMALYLPCLRDHTRRTKIKKELEEKHQDLCQTFWSTTEKYFGTLLSRNQELSLLATVYRLHIWGKSRGNARDKFSTIMRCFDPHLSNDHIKALFRDADAV